MKRKGARLGQHFLTGTWAAKKLTEAAGITSEDTVLEIGPGKGALTKDLLATGARVIAIEKDPVLVEILEKMFADSSLTVVKGDVRDIDLEKIGVRARKYILAANIPYYITGEIIRRFLSAKAQPRTMALLVQKEVAERILARDGKESILSISVKVYGTPSIAAKVSRGNFSPPPSVDSAILVVRNISKEFFGDVGEEDFFKIVKAGFSSKRKFLLNNLGVFGRDRSAQALAAAGVPEKARAEDVRLDQWKKIATELDGHR